MTEKNCLDEKVLKDVNGGDGDEIHDLVFAINDVDPDANIRSAEELVPYLKATLGIDLVWDTWEKNIYTDQNGKKLTQNEVYNMVYDIIGKK